MCDSLRWCRTSRSRQRSCHGSCSRWEDWVLCRARYDVPYAGSHALHGRCPYLEHCFIIAKTGRCLGHASNVDSVVLSERRQSQQTPASGARLTRLMSACRQTTLCGMRPSRSSMPRTDMSMRPTASIRCTTLPLRPLCSVAGMRDEHACRRRLCSLTCRLLA